MKALVGAWDSRPQHVMAEIAALRGRIRQLEQELARTREENAALRSEHLDMDIEIALTSASA